MVDTVESRFELKLTVKKTRDVTSGSLAANPITDHVIPNSFGVLNASTSVPATKVWSDEANLSSGTVTLDLTALVQEGLTTAIDFTGLKVQLIKIRNRSTNTETMTIAGGSSNPYELFGDASGQVTLAIGGELLIYGRDALADVSSTVKNVTITSDDTNATYDIILVAG